MPLPRPALLSGNAGTTMLPGHEGNGEGSMAKAGRGRRKVATGMGDLVGLQLAMLGLSFRLLETSAHAAGVIARRSLMLGAATLEPAKLADPEFVRMVAEKAEAAGEAWLRAARHTARALPAGPADAVALAASGVALAESCLRPYHRRVRANARRLGRAG